MTEDKGARADIPERAQDAGEGMAAPPRQRRLSAQRKQEVVLRLLRGEDLDLVSRDVGVTAADLSGWRDRFLSAPSISTATLPLFSCPCVGEVPINTARATRRVAE